MKFAIKLARIAFAEDAAAAAGGSTAAMEEADESGGDRKRMRGMEGWQRAAAASAADGYWR